MISWCRRCNRAARPEGLGAATLAATCAGWARPEGLGAATLAAACAGRCAVGAAAFFPVRSPPPSRETSQHNHQHNQALNPCLAQRTWRSFLAGATVMHLLAGGSAILFIEDQQGRSFPAAPLLGRGRGRRAKEQTGSHICRPCTSVKAQRPAARQQEAAMRPHFAKPLLSDA